MALENMTITTASLFISNTQVRQLTERHLWRLKRSDRVKVRKQTSQVNGRSLVWIIEWRVRSVNTANFAEHWLQACGLSPECLLVWRRKSAERENDFPHSEQTCDRVSPCFCCTWAFSATNEGKVQPHLSHTWRLVVLCVNTCRFRRLLCIKRAPQSEHSYDAATSNPPPPPCCNWTWLCSWLTWEKLSSHILQTYVQSAECCCICVASATSSLNSTPQMLQQTHFVVSRDSALAESSPVSCFPSQWFMPLACKS